MLQSIYSGVSGLQSFQTGIDVLANNIANINTVGFKGSSTEFSNLFEKAVNSGSTTTSQQLGLGTKISATSLDLSTGSYSQTQNPMDLAIIGNDGWFGLSGSNNTQFFTRAGNFHLDPFASSETQTDVRLVSTDGFFVTGTLANNTANGILNPIVDSLDLDLANVTSQEPLIFPQDLVFPVQPTTQAEFFGNIGVDNVPQTISATVISPQSEKNNLRLVFTQTTPQPATGISWDVTATTQTADGSVIYDTQNGVVTFDGSGALLSSSLGTINNNGAPVLIDLGTGFSGVSSNSGATLSSGAVVDGVVGGDLISYTVNRSGEVISNFTNGRQSVVGKVAIYHFQNDQGLEAVGSTNFRISANSGPAIFYEQNNGELLSSTLETSNVTLETALTELIIMQRSYDAAAKTISTADQLLQNALRM